MFDFNEEFAKAKAAVTKKPEAKKGQSQRQELLTWDKYVKSEQIGPKLDLEGVQIEPPKPKKVLSEAEYWAQQKAERERQLKQELKRLESYKYIRDRKRDPKYDEILQLAEALTAFHDLLRQKMEERYRLFQEELEQTKPLSEEEIHHRALEYQAALKVVEKAHKAGVTQDNLLDQADSYDLIEHKPVEGVIPDFFAYVWNHAQAWNKPAGVMGVKAEQCWFQRAPLKPNPSPGIPGFRQNYELVFTFVKTMHRTRRIIKDKEGNKITWVIRPQIQDVIKHDTWQGKDGFLEIERVLKPVEVKEFAVKKVQLQKMQPKALKDRDRDPKEMALEAVTLGMDGLIAEAKKAGFTGQAMIDRAHKKLTWATRFLESQEDANPEERQRRAKERAIRESERRARQLARAEQQPKGKRGQKPSFKH